MPRRNRPKGSRGGDEEPFSTTLPAAAPPGWTALTITADRAQKTYVCPGCHRDILPNTAHIVAWQSGRDDHRRHWHTGCWRSGSKELARGDQPRW